MELFDKAKDFIIKHNLIDFKTRNYKLSLVAMTMNFATAAFKIIAAFYVSSYFLIVSSIYSVGIGLTKQIFFRGVIKSKLNPRKERKYVLLIYTALFVSSLVYMFYMIRLFYIETRPFNYGMFISLIIAIVSVYELVIAIIGLIKSHHLRDSLLTALKTVTLTSALVAIVVAQSALIIFITDQNTILNNKYSNAIFGLLMGFIAAVISLAQFIRNYKKKFKPLSEMSLEELWELFPIFLVPHNDAWIKRFNIEKRYLLSHISDGTILRIEHVGSTAIESIQAKDIIDMLVIIDDDINMMDVAFKLKKLGYLIMSKSDNRVSLNKGYTKYGFARDVFHLHLRRKEDCDEIYFRDYMNQHPEEARDYESLKIFLAEMHKNNRDAYTEAKTDFIMRITENAKKKKNKKQRN